MSRNRPLPAGGFFLAIATALGLARGTGDVVQEATSPHAPVDPTNQASGDDIRPKVLWIIGISVIGCTWISILLLYPLFTYFKYERTGGLDPAKALVYAPPQPPRPRNVAHPYQYLADIRKSEDGQLNHYYWVDKTKGVVAIPIARAIQILAQRGIPPSPKPNAANQYYAPTAASMQTGFEDKTVPEQQ